MVYSFNQLIPRRRLTSCNNLEIVKSVFTINLPRFIGANFTNPLERDFFPFPNSKKLLLDDTINPAIVQHARVTKHQVALLSINALKSFPKTLLVTTINILSFSTLWILISFFFPLSSSTQILESVEPPLHIYGIALGKVFCLQTQQLNSASVARVATYWVRE